jgi:hypothetical protein
MTSITLPIDHSKVQLPIPPSPIPIPAPGEPEDNPNIVGALAYMLLADLPWAIFAFAWTWVFWWTSMLLFLIPIVGIPCVLDVRNHFVEGKLTRSLLPRSPPYQILHLVCPLMACSCTLGTHYARCHLPETRSASESLGLETRREGLVGLVLGGLERQAYNAGCRLEFRQGLPLLSCLLPLVQSDSLARSR